MDAMLQNIKLKKRLEYLSSLANENQELRELVNVLTQTVEEQKTKVDDLKKALNDKVDGENILDATEYAIEKVREFD